MMDSWVLVLAFGMPAAIFLLALRALVVRLRLEGRGALIGATIVEVRPPTKPRPVASATHRAVTSAWAQLGVGLRQLLEGRCLEDLNLDLLDPESRTPDMWSEFMQARVVS